MSAGPCDEVAVLRITGTRRSAAMCPRARRLLALYTTPRAVLAAAETAVHAHIHARATSGHVATAPPRSVMKSRRLMM